MPPKSNHPKNKNKTKQKKCMCMMYVYIHIYIWQNRAHINNIANKENEL